MIVEKGVAYRELHLPDFPTVRYALISGEVVAPVLIHQTGIEFHIQGASPVKRLRISNAAPHAVPHILSKDRVVAAIPLFLAEVRNGETVYESREQLSFMEDAQFVEVYRDGRLVDRYVSPVDTADTTLLFLSALRTGKFPSRDCIVDYLFSEN